MVDDQEQQNLLLEAHKINYRLRSTFFYRKLVEYGTYQFPETIRRLLPLADSFSWEKSEEWGISSDAFTQIEKSELSLIQVFSHPRLLREHIHLTAYYRNVAALSQKSVGYLADIPPQKFENGQSDSMDQQQALSLSVLFNEHISLIIESALQGFGQRHIEGILFASTGAQIDGSWRNAIGEEAEKVVQKLLIRGAIESSVLTGFLLREQDGGVEEFDNSNLPALLERVSEFRGFMLKNKRSILFSSEPDISLLDEDGSTIGVIEVKGGIDPAGALERYGAAKKSFEEALRCNSSTVTILVASCITSEVEARVRKDRTIKKFYNLTSLVTTEDSRKEFLEYLFGSLLKCSEVP